MRIAFTNRCLLVLAAVASWAALSSTGRADEPLRWKFKVGEQLDYQMTQQMNMDMDAGKTGQMHTSMNQTMNMQWDVKGVDDKGDAVIEQAIKRVQMKMEVARRPGLRVRLAGGGAGGRHGGNDRADVRGDDGRRV